MDTVDAQKPISEITFRDFAAHPVWTWANRDDESLVEPLEPLNGLPTDDPDIGYLFVASAFILHDGTELDGMVGVSVNFTKREVYLLSFRGTDDDLLDFNLDPHLRDIVSVQQLSDWLGRRVEDIFPIIYRTPFRFVDGMPLAGQIGYPPRQDVLRVHQ